MKNGTLPQRILRAIHHKRMKRPFFTRAMFGSFGDYDQVGRALKKLADEKLIEHVDRGVFRVLYTGEQPRLSIPRTWSRPSGVDDETLIATTIANPTYSDIARLCIYYGVKRVEEIADNLDIDKRIKANVQRMIKNARIGIVNAHKEVPHRESAR